MINFWLGDIDQFRNAASWTNECSMSWVRPFCKSGIGHHGLFTFGLAFAKEARHSFLDFGFGGVFSVAMTAHPSVTFVKKIVEFDHLRLERRAKRPAVPLSCYSKRRGPEDFVDEPSSLTGRVVVLPSRRTSTRIVSPICFLSRYR
jgi:hypothetical protein